MNGRARFRSIWVVVVNGLLAAWYIRWIVWGIRADLQDSVKAYRADFPDLQNVASVLILLSGIVLELVRSKAAKFVNIGYFSLVAAWAVLTFGAEMLGLLHADGMSFVFLVYYGIPSLIIAAVDWYLYRTPRGLAHQGLKQRPA